MDTRKFFIKPQIPEKLEPLHELAFNMWSCWDRDAERLFHRLDPQMFRKLNHNPVELLYRMDTERLKEVAKDKGFLYELKQVYDKYKRYLEFEGTYLSGGEDKPFTQDDLVVYICTEYGLHESVPTYSGGLAVLAGDLLKAASDVGFPMVGFGLLYRYGYFSQKIGTDDNQIEEFHENSWYLSQVREVSDSSGNPMVVEVPLGDKKVFAKIWKIQIGRVPLYLLDTNIHQNPTEFRNITNMLYDPNRRTRLEQELILGRGTIIALKALGIKPRVYHLNEGHTAFSILQRMIDLVKGEGYTFEEARNIIRYSTVFTTHTPVIEGNESFQEDLVKEYLEGEAKTLGYNIDNFLAFGRINESLIKTDKEKIFWLPAFAIRYSNFTNGVSKIHAKVSRGMWRNIFPTLSEREIPITGITNGVHLQSWLSLQMTELFNRYIGPDYMHKAEKHEIWDGVYDIPDGEIWNAHRRRKEQVVSFIRRRLAETLGRKGYGRGKIKDIEKVLNPNYLTIGFARRFATYKRANLILNDPDRLASIITDKDRPVQLVFAGKAHPADKAGKNIIKQVLDFINSFPVENHVVFIEDYDINVARHMVQGVDVWLNTPLKPMEASGTSGMKAGINGILNLSILDGWWPEAFNGENGWAITVGENDESAELSPEVEASQIYELLENDITELFYERAEGDMPLEWVRMMKNSIATICRGFSMQRTVREYLYNFYLPQVEMEGRLLKEDGQLLKDLVKYRKKIDSIWQKVYIRDYFTSINGKVPVSGEDVDIDCYAYLDDVEDGLLSVEVFYCYGEETQQYKKVPLAFVERYADKVGKFSGRLSLEGAGLQELSVRLVPSDPDFRKVYPEYVKWKE